METAPNSVSRPEAACGACGLADHCSAASSEVRGPFRGASLVLASLVYFLVPVALALLGAVLGGDSALRQLLGGLTGLALGMLATTAVAHRLGVSADPEACFEPR